MNYDYIETIVGYVGAGIALLALIISGVLAYFTLQVFRQNSTTINKQNHNEDKEELYKAIRTFNNYLKTTDIKYDGDKSMMIEDAVKALQEAYDNNYNHAFDTQVEAAYKLLNRVYEYYLFTIETCNAIKFIPGADYGEKLFTVTMGKGVELEAEAVKNWDALCWYLSVMSEKIAYLRNFSNFMKFHGDIKSIPTNSLTPFHQKAKQGGKVLSDVNDIRIYWKAKVNVCLYHLDHTDRLFAKAIAAGKEGKDGRFFIDELNRFEYWNDESKERKRIKSLIKTKLENEEKNKEIKAKMTKAEVKELEGLTPSDIEKALFYKATK